jgi:CheY-like chemotaxis protein
MAYETIGRSMEVLLVQYDLGEAKQVIDVLAGAGFNHRLTLVRDVQEAADFLHRIERFSRAPRPNLVVLGQGRSPDDARQVLRIVRGTDDLKSIPVVLVTDDRQQERMLADARLFVEVCFVQPVDWEAFLLIVRELNRFWIADDVMPLVKSTTAVRSAS